MDTTVNSMQDLLGRARRLYASSVAAQRELDQIERRLSEPLRVALIGSVKAGKSTLLNAILGERIAPTDSRECTRIVTWYHHGAVPAVQGHLVGGETITIPTRRHEDRLELELADLTSEQFDRIDVTWPAPGVRGLTLIDTPGIASISQDVSGLTSEFLLPDDGAAGADAVIYLMRSLHESDVRYIRTLHERTRHGRMAIGSIAVLSRADELGGGRLDAILSISDAVDQLRENSDLRDTCETIVPVAGLMGLGAVSLRQSDFAVLRRLAAEEPDRTRQALLSAERFITAKDEWLPSELVRLDLVERFGMYGVRLAIAAIRGGVNDAGDLSAELARRSGLEELRRVIDVHFVQRQPQLKAHSAALALHALVARYPVQGSRDFGAHIDEYMAGARDFEETNLVGRIASGQINLPAESLEELSRLIGGRGIQVRDRLGITSREVRDDELLMIATQHLVRWREQLDNPLLDRLAHRACKVAERSCETIIIDLLSDADRNAAMV